MSSKRKSPRTDEEAASSSKRVALPVDQNGVEDELAFAIFDDYEDDEYEDDDEDYIEDDEPVRHPHTHGKTPLATDPNDTRLGSPISDLDLRLSLEEKRNRCARFEEYARIIISNKKALARRGLKLFKARNGQPRPLCNRFMAIILNADEEFLLQTLLEGIGEETRWALGQDEFSIADVLDLPTVCTLLQSQLLRTHTQIEALYFIQKYYLF